MHKPSLEELKLRLHTLQESPKENQAICKKLSRRIRALENK